MNPYTEAHIDFMAVKLATRPNLCSAADLDHASSMLIQLVRNCNELHQQLATIADKVREECASAAWLHYMDVCKKHGHGPNVERIRDFCSTEAIRAMKEPKL